MTDKNTVSDREATIAEREAKRKENDARDRAIHDALGLCPHPIASWYHEGPDGDRTINCGLCKSSGSLFPEGYSTDPAAFEALLQEIGRRGLLDEYVLTLDGIVSPDAGLSWQVWQVSAIVSAPQSIRAAAALAVLTEGTNG